MSRPPAGPTGKVDRPPPTALTPVLTLCAEVEGGFSAKVANLTVDPGARSGQKLRIRTTGALLEIPVGAVGYEALRTLFPWAQDATRSVP